MKVMTILICLFAAGCGDGTQMSAGGAAKSVMAQAYLCGQLEAQGKPEPGCSTPAAYVAEIGPSALLDTIRRNAAAR